MKTLATLSHNRTAPDKNEILYIALRVRILVLLRCRHTAADDAAGKPELTTRPYDIDVSFGGTAYFNCRADGDPRPEIIWYRDR